MNWLKELFTNQESVAHIVLLYSLVISLGVYLGKIKIGGISLGVTFILFVGILAGHFRTHRTDINADNFARLWSYSVRLYDWFASRTGLLRELWQGRTETEHACLLCNYAEHCGNVCLLLHLL